MGKGSNVQKKQQAQLRNSKDRGKTEEERKAAAQKAKYVVIRAVLLKLRYICGSIVARLLLH